MNKVYVLLGLILLTSNSSASDCPMNPPPLDPERIAHSSLVKNITIDKSKLALSALLKSGRFFRLIHSGCNHSGATAILWLETDLSMEDTDAWIKEAQSLLQLAFVPSVANAIAKSLSTKKFSLAANMSRLEIDGEIPDYIDYNIVVSAADYGVLLSISYSIG